MRILDSNFKTNVSRYLLQCLLAAVIIFIVLFLVGKVFDMVIVASLGASTFISFTVPQSNPSRPRFLIGGYVVGSMCGILMNYLSRYLISTNVLIFGLSPNILICALAVGLAMLLMTVFDFEHPPAAALAMGLAADSNVWVTAAVAIACIVTISLFKTAIKRWLINLL